MNLSWHIIITQLAWFTMWFSLGVVYSMDFNKQIKACIHQYCNTQNSYPAVKFPVLCLFPSNFCQLLAATDLFTVSLVLPFISEYRIVGIIWYVAFSDWIIHLAICTFKILLSSYGLHAHFFLVLSNTSSSGCITVYLFTCWRAFWLLLSFHNHE